MSEEVRREPGIHQDVLRGVHRKLNAVSVRLPGDPTAADLRDLFAGIRVNRNKIARILSALTPRVAHLRADLIRVERIIEAESAERLDTNKGLSHATSAAQRTAILKTILRRWYDARAEIRSDLVLAEEAVSHAKLVRDEMKYAFEEASRSLASVQLEYQIECSAP